MRTRVAVALSGGVDSMMAATLLKEKHFDVFGVHFETGFESGPGRGKLTRLAERLGICMHFIDLSEVFQRRVVDYFENAYASGKTPNPCLVCNPEIKFGELFRFCRRLGATHLATGHYARVRKAADGIYHLYRGKDAAKDQSYFLSRLTQAQLSIAFFPLGGLTKGQVKEMAKQRTLVPAAARESQDICFLRGAAYGEFLTSRPGFSPKPGKIEDRRGNVLGSHPGLHLFTVGQRRGINCPADAPYYVLGMEAATGRLIVGKKSETYCPSCTVEAIRWISPPPFGGMRGSTRIRYRHRAVPSFIRITGSDTAHVRFETLQKAVTPGQGAVFYRADEVLGGGWIAEAPPRGGMPV